MHILSYLLLVLALCLPFLGASEPARGQPLTLAPASSISGRVTLDGRPLADVIVQDGDGHRATTDADGRYALTGLAPGAYALIPIRPGYVFTPASQTVTVPPDLADADFAAQAAFTVALPSLGRDVRTRAEGGWDIVRAYPDMTARLTSVALIDAGEGWAVGGDNGLCALMHLEGGVWHDVACPAPTPQAAVALADRNTGWAVGDRFMRLANGAWSLVGPAPVRRLVALALAKPDTGWAVGDGGVIYHLQQGTWTRVPSPTTSNLRAVALVDADNGWAVGEAGAALRLQGGSWTLQYGGTFANLNAVALSDANTGWAVGDSGNVVTLHIDHWDRVVPSPSYANFYGVALSGTDGWVVGEWGEILRLENGEWTRLHLVPGQTPPPMLAVAVIGRSWAWAVGAGVIARYTGP